jgi:ComF family protein
MAQITVLRPWVDAAFNFIFPPICQICEQERAGAAEGFVCEACRRRVRWVAPPFCERCGLPFEGEITETFECSNCHDLDLYFRFARSAIVADSLVLDIIHRYKYSRNLWFETFLANALIEKAAPQLMAGEWDWIVPVPLHHSKKREREFNQTERLGSCLANATGIPMNARLVQRVKATETQTTLGKRERAANMAAAFAVREGLRLDGKKIVIIDDVLTTGATTSACARALRMAGAEDVGVWTVARGT